MGKREKERIKREQVMYHQAGIRGAELTLRFNRDRMVALVCRGRIAEHKQALADLSRPKR